MLRFTIQRLLTGVPTLLVLIAAAFFLIRAAPGGPFDSERDLPPEIEANLRQAYHLDEPLPRQFARYLGNLARGDFGPSLQYRDFSVTELIRAGFPVSLRIGSLAMLLALLAGVSAGAWAALRQNSAGDHLVMAAAMTGISIPNFVMAPLLVLVVAVGLGWLPAGGYGGGAWRHLVLPVITLALPQVAYLARLTRASMIEVLSSPYIRTARAQGLSSGRILLRHALRPALLPVVSYLGPATAAVITGSVVIEQIFGLPGIGRFFVTGALNRDYTLVMGVVVFYGALILLGNFLVDLVYGLLDPRIRHLS
ncbi:Oligopeptide transport system permease protein OppB [Gammaproteobacteria bacterium]|nr:oligopeptide ABC transporter permease OppB [Gammaproteobacteria bacterium]QOJ32882.1 MAG: oligopeptide ABC transporter permease OppB [Gammaproteobacteria bacterium]CAG0943518.1 Oligopeptide transport system permease protein OppB [Gammaproteobacteria bacterium]